MHDCAVLFPVWAAEHRSLWWNKPAVKGEKRRGESGPFALNVQTQTDESTDRMSVPGQSAKEGESVFFGSFLCRYKDKFVGNEFVQL